MKLLRVRNGWVSSVVPLLSVALFNVACASTTTVVATAPPPPSSAASYEEDDFSQLIAQMRSDLNRNAGRQIEKKPATASKAPAAAAKERDKEFAARAKALFAPLHGNTLQMPVVGIRPFELTNSWGNPRDGGKRKHKGIDIFAPKGTPIVAVADGVISYIGEQPKGGNCLWLTTENGASFYYAHLDRWAPGLYEGMEVRSGELLGYVGNTGNAKYTPSHLHFGVNENDEMVNPYPLLTRAVVVHTARATAEGGGAVGTR